MSASIELKDYNQVAQDLLVPFDDSEISQREGSGNQTFSFVPPERYRYRLLRIFSNGFTFSITNTVEGKSGVKGTGHFIGEVPEDGVRYDITVDVFESWTFKKDSDVVLNRDQSYSKLASAGLKACAREMGLGLHLYDKAVKKSSSVKPATKTSVKPSASKTSTVKSKVPASDGDHGDYSQYFDENWDGSDELRFTKQKGTAYSELEDGMISWLINKDDQEGNPNPDKGALKEMARRMADGGSNAQERAEKSVDEDEDYPF